MPHHRTAPTGCGLVMCCMERTHDSDPTRTIVVRFRLRQYGTSSTARSLSRLESPRVVQSRPELPGVIRYRPESESSGVVRSCSESSESSESSKVVWSRSESELVGVNSSRVILCACDQTFPFVMFFCLSLCACTSYTSPPRPTPDDSGRFRTSPNDSFTTLDDSR